MFRFLGENMSVNIPENQIKEMILYRRSIYIKLFNGAYFEVISEKEKELEKIFTELKIKSNYGNFINMKEEN